MAAEDRADTDAVRGFVESIADNAERVIRGKRHEIELLLVAILAEGHVLLEDVPGTGKTMLARAVAVSTGLDFRRIQCTPDLLPNDVTGVNVYDQSEATFRFREGPVFANVVLADEINRATPRTQSALLEAMQERQVTADGVARRLPTPFLVLATQNPVEFEGTFPLPEAQLDRFLLRLRIGYPGHEIERGLVESLRGRHPIDDLEQVVDGARLPELAATVSEIHIDDTVRTYIVDLVHATRDHDEIALGASPRATLALSRTSRALAAVRGRDFVVPDDVKELAPLVLPHRVMVAAGSELRGRTADDLIESILDEVELDLEGEPAGGASGG
jgi:MoxR-like ATPase